MFHASSYSPSGHDDPPGVRAMHCAETVCRLLVPPRVADEDIATAAAAELTLRQLVQVLPAVEAGLGGAVRAWHQYVLHIDGKSYAVALRVAHVLLGCAGEAVKACCRVMRAIHSDGEGLDEQAALSGSEDFNEAETTANLIAAHASSLTVTVGRTKIRALQGAMEQLRSHVMSYRDIREQHVVDAAIVTAVQELQRRWPLTVALGDAQRNMLGDTFKVPHHVHDVLEVNVNVGRAIRGEDVGVDADLDKSAPVPLPMPHSSSFNQLLSSPAVVDGAHAWSSLWQRVRNEAAAAFGCPAVRDGAQAVPWSTIATIREDPGGMARLLQVPQQHLFSLVANHLHTVIGRYPHNMTAFYAMAVVLCDVCVLLDPFDVPLSQLPARGREAAPNAAAGRIDASASASAETEDRAPSAPAEHNLHRALPVIQPDNVAHTFPGDALACLTAIHQLVGIGVDKLYAEIDRLIATAAASFEIPPANSGPDQPSGALVTVLSSAAQPLLAVFSRYPAASVHSIAQLLQQVLGHVIERVTWRWAYLKRSAKGKKGHDVEALSKDLLIFRRFFANHPSLQSAHGEDARLRRSLVLQAFARDR
jgi:hypothetical protein